MAAVATHDKNVNIIGSDDATTCIIVVVRHSGKLKRYFIVELKFNQLSFFFRMKVWCTMSHDYRCV